MWQRAAKAKEKIDKQISILEKKLAELREKATEAAKEEAATRKELEAITKEVVYTYFSVRMSCFVLFICSLHG